MKRICLALFSISLLILTWACNKNSDAPSVSFTVSAIDPSKVSALDSLTIDNIIQNHVDSFFVPVLPNISTSVYNRTLFFKYTGGGADFRVIYTGDASHVYDPKNDSIANTADNFTNPYYAHKYAMSDTFTVTILANNIKSGGSEIKSAKLSEIFIIK